MSTAEAAGAAEAVVDDTGAASTAKNTAAHATANFEIRFILTVLLVLDLRCLFTARPKPRLVDV